MKKLTLAIVGTVFISGASAADYNKLNSHLPGRQQIVLQGANAGQNLLQGGLADSIMIGDQPILRDHGVQQVLREETPESSIAKDNCDGLNSFEKYDEYGIHNQHREDCDCDINNWGCDAGSSHHKPGARHIEESRASVTTTVVPVQTLITNTTQTINGDVCSVSLGKRERDDGRNYEVEGRFKQSSYDVQQECNTQGECFNEQGQSRDKYWDVNTDHSVNACECKDISGKDFLGFDAGCECAKNHVEDPDSDIERRIVRTVEKTISDLLSEIVSRCISESMEGSIAWE